MIGIAVINYNTYEKTIECIDSIKKTTNSKYKVYLIDNASQNESAQVLSEIYKDDVDVNLILSKDNLGYAKGNNVCIDAMIEDGCKYGIISNNDIVCYDNCIDTLVRDLKEKNELLLVGPKMETPSGVFQKTVKLKEYGRLEYLNRNTYLAYFHKKAIRNEQIEVERISDFKEVKWVSGAFFAFNVEKMNSIGKFDPNTFLFFEESILAKKAEMHNMKLAYNPNAKVIHYHSYSTGGWSNVISKISADRSEMYYQNNYCDNGRVFMFILRVIRKMEVCFTFGKRRDFESIRLYFKETKKTI